jgi:Tfp pilus assembly protein PilP
MGGSLRTILGVNKFQAVFVTSAVFLFFVCVRTYAPFPEFIMPQTQVVEDEPLQQTSVSVVALLEVGPHWLEDSRDTFRVHPDFSTKIIAPPKPKEVDEPVIPPPPIEVEDDPTPPLREVPELAENEIIDRPPVEPKPERIFPMDQLSMVNPVTVTRPEPPKIKIKPKTKPKPKPGVVPDKPKEGIGRETLIPEPEPEVEPIEPYELPFQLQGIIRANQERGPLVILKDKESGKRVRRYQGQRFNGVVIKRIGPGTVEVEVPDEDLQFRYVDTMHKWLPM